MEYDDVVTSATPGSGDYMPLHPSRRSWEITRQVNIIKVIGKGAFSEVAKATLWNLRENQKVITVAAKMLRGTARFNGDILELSKLDFCRVGEGLYYLRPRHFAVQN